MDIKSLEQSMDILFVVYLRLRPRFGLTVCMYMYN